MTVPVAVSCHILQVQRRGYYHWLKNPISAREKSDGVLLEKIVALHKENPGDRYRLKTDELVKQGEIVGKNRVRVCQINGGCGFFHLLFYSFRGSLCRMLGVLDASIFVNL